MYSLSELPLQSEYVTQPESVALCVDDGDIDIDDEVASNEVVAVRIEPVHIPSHFAMEFDPKNRNKMRQKEYVTELRSAPIDTSKGGKQDIFWSKF